LANHNNWYEQAFNRRYVELYAHRDENECTALYDTLAALGLFPANGIVVDAACGNGRWLKILRLHNQPATGFDLSTTQLKFVENEYVVRANLLQFPYQSKSVTVVTSIFSSFGYFDSVAEDIQQLTETARILKVGGWFIIDTAPPRTLEHLVPEGSHTFSDGVTAKIQRNRDGIRAIKTVTLDTGDYWEEKLRIYEEHEIDAMAQSVGLQLQWRIGDYTGETYHPGTSPRMIGCYVRTN